MSKPYKTYSRICHKSPHKCECARVHDAHYFGFNFKKIKISKVVELVQAKVNYFTHLKLLFKKHPYINY